MVDVDFISKKFATLILTALGLCVGFFWYEALKEFFLPYADKYGLFFTAIIVTVLAIIVAGLLNKYVNGD